MRRVLRQIKVGGFVSKPGRFRGSRLRLSSFRIFARKSGTANGLATGSRPGRGRSVCARTYPTADNAYSAPSRAVAAVYSFRPLAGRSLASVVVRTAERVAAADRQIHRGELHA